MKRLGIFGLLFFLFWAIPFPMIMYYPMSAMTTGSTPTWAFIWLAVSLILWILLFRTLFKLLVLTRFIARRNLANLMQNGELKTATITNIAKLPPEMPGIDKYKLTLQLQNFVGTPINEYVTINDDTPFQHRFEAGKTIKLRIDKTLKNVPYMQIEGAHYNPPTPRGLILSFIIWAILVGIVAAYYIYSYQRENNGTGWQFMIAWHPLIICPFILMLFTLFFRTAKFTKNQLKHKYYGYKALATVVSVTQTGVYINNQPQVRFQLEYTDRNNKINSVTFTKTITVLNTALAQQKTFDIFYLENDPQNICLATDLET